MAGVIGGIIIVLVCLAMIPTFLIGGGFLMAIAGHLFTKDAEARHEGSELIETNT